MIGCSDPKPRGLKGLSDGSDEEEAEAPDAQRWSLATCGDVCGGGVATSSRPVECAAGCCVEWPRGARGATDPAA
eukprot:CAMPEP_0176100404 /NCGR_PEP_ID=MMETSP0120_2-20121206/50356_1 /TAXON_ID=160619 /ORGANISM="Kryptoperidinium foliaceum, Strain CCMP 1326" /LENGTH=74 /DNA_ID=CAMNT_0017434445 /DNA_START=12 /DNA_END=234 /DNA_ORIENTATION=-